MGSNSYRQKDQQQADLAIDQARSIFEKIVSLRKDIRMRRTANRATAADMLAARRLAHMEEWAEDIIQAYQDEHKMQ